MSKPWTWALYFTEGVKHLADRSKLQKLAAIEGLSVDKMLERSMFDSASPGICVNKDCDYTTEVEPDCDSGYCEECGTQTVKSALMLAGLI